MATTTAHQISMDNALVAPEKRVEIGKCNMRIDPKKTQKEPTTRDVITRNEQFWVTINKHGSSYQFKIDKKRLSVDMEVFREIHQICPRLMIKNIMKPPSSQQENLLLHQGTWTTLHPINKCLSGKITSLDEICLSKAQILCGMYYKKNIDFVALLWEDFAFQIDNRDAKKQEKMYHPGFIKAIIHHFLSKGKSISMRNRMFMHTAHDDCILGTMRFVFKDKDTQVNGVLIPTVMTTLKIRDSPAYQTYLAFATEATTPKSKRIYKKPASPMIKTTTTSLEETPSKKKSASAITAQNLSIRH
ncbi:hypothetical protein Tco_0944550 [Tanacetum coccineum]